MHTTAVDAVPTLVFTTSRSVERVRVGAGGRREEESGTRKWEKGDEKARELEDKILLKWSDYC